MLCHGLYLQMFGLQRLSVLNGVEINCISYVGWTV